MPKKRKRIIVGKITQVEIKGIQGVSAQLVLVVENRREQLPLQVRSLPAHEPQIFVSIANFVTTAYWNGRTIRVEYVPPSDKGGVADVVGVYVPAEGYGN
ncbi:MAG: hypothetical protein ACKVRN_14065 [Pyrinomonadaceae bacterium]